MNFFEVFIRRYMTGILRHVPIMHIGLLVTLLLLLIIVFSVDSDAEYNPSEAPLALDSHYEPAPYTAPKNFGRPQIDPRFAKQDGFVTPTDSLDTHTQVIEQPDIETDNSEALALEDSFLANEVPVEPKTPLVDDPITHTVTVKKGDSLSKIFERVGISSQTLRKILKAPEAKNLKRIRPGQTFEFTTENGNFLSVAYDKSALSRVTFEQKNDQLVAKESVIEPEIKQTYQKAIIRSSLFLDGKRAGISDNVIMQLAKIFAWDIDFALDIRKNDQLHVLIEEQYVNGKRIGKGKILAAKFVNRNQVFEAVRFIDSSGSTHYYTPEGRSMRKAFLRSPVDFARISSHFNLRRKHPVLNRIRAHKGTDYAAATGTPIRSAGDGKIIFAGVKGGYGRTVIVQHNKTYKTLYAHMSRYGKYKQGSRVKQGQIIGYVGSSGLATGPHLHYEFYVNGRVKNPVTVPLPKALPVPNSERGLFNKQTKPLMLSLNNYLNKDRTQHAMLNNNNHANTN